MLRYGELFAGVGGLSLGLHRAGWECAFHAEIDDFAARVLRHHWPDVPVYGDVASLEGRELVAKTGPIDLLSGGSPCQDLSQAGRRAGIIYGERSNLFFQQVRLWNETGAPFLLWENVCGALSSSQGEDFRYVLSALVGADVGRAVDKKGRDLKWANSGVVCGPAGRAAWRVLDAQFWGPPQRRRRVFVLAARPGFPDPEEVLFEREGVLGDFAAGVSAEEGAPTAAGRSAARRRGTRAHGTAPVIAFNSHSNGEDLSQSRNYGVTPPLTGESEGTHTPAVVVFDTKQSGESVEGAAPTLRAMNYDKSWLNGGGQLGVVRAPTEAEVRERLAKHKSFWSSLTEDQKTAFLEYDGPEVIGDPNVFAFDKAQITHPANRSRVELGKPVPSLNASGKMHVARMVAFGSYVEDGTASAMKARDYKDATDLVYGATPPRRLLPIECERLMDWDDNWTDVPDEKGKPASDSARYRVCGNGVVSACVEWIGLRLAAILSSEHRRAA